jgi:hypothetical protein
MTEQEWLTSEDPAAMLDHHGWMLGPWPNPTTSPRKLRLWACAVTRLAVTPDGIPSVEVAERYADGLIDAAALESDAGANGYWCAQSDRYLLDACLELCRVEGRCCPELVPPKPCAMLRDVFGNPWRPTMLCESGKLHNVRDDTIAVWTNWLTSDVVALAHAAYDERLDDGKLDNDRLAVLSDALEEAGCPTDEECARCSGHGWLGKIRHVAASKTRPCDAPGCRTGRVPHRILDHLRSPGPHYRGCWAVDTIIGKE